MKTDQKYLLEVTHDELAYISTCVGVQLASEAGQLIEAMQLAAASKKWTVKLHTDNTLGLFLEKLEFLHSTMHDHGECYGPENPEGKL